MLTTKLATEGRPVGLPGIGHACGHNLIAEAGAVAGLGLKAALEKGGLQGTVTVMGTPAEEGGGGKVKLIDNGAFKDVDIAMIVHPFTHTFLRPVHNARKGFIVNYTGKAAHAAAYPWEGLNALNAAELAYNSVSVLCCVVATSDQDSELSKLLDQKAYTDEANLESSLHHQQGWGQTQHHSGGE